MTEETANEKPLILVVDDEETDCELVRRLLGPDYILREAMTGKQGRAMAAEERPDLVLLDYRLPDMNSFDLLREMVADYIAVIILTGEERPEAIISSIQEGAFDYLIKSQLTPEAIKQAIVHGIEKATLKRNLAEQTEQIRELASALTLAEQRERKRAALILHDHVQQILYGVQMRTHLVQQDVATDAPAEVRENLTEALQLVEEAIDATRSLSVYLSPPVDKEDGIGVALQWLALHIEKMHGLHVDLQIDTEDAYSTESEELHVLVIDLVRELLFNVVKHANVKEVDVRMFMEDEERKIVVQDDGVGFEAGKVVKPTWTPKEGYGLYSVRERLALFGGRLDVDSHPGNGARITIVLPKTLEA